MNLQTNDGFCYECYRHIGPVVEIGTMDDHGHVDQESGGTFCLECLRKAVALLEAVLGSAGAAWERNNPPPGRRLAARRISPGRFQRVLRIGR